MDLTRPHPPELRFLSRARGRQPLQPIASIADAIEAAFDEAPGSFELTIHRLRLNPLSFRTNAIRALAGRIDQVPVAQRVDAFHRLRELAASLDSDRRVLLMQDMCDALGHLPLERRQGAMHALVADTAALEASDRMSTCCILGATLARLAPGERLIAYEAVTALITDMLPVDALDTLAWHATTLRMVPPVERHEAFGMVVRAIGGIGQGAAKARALAAPARLLIELPVHDRAQAADLLLSRLGDLAKSERDEFWRTLRQVQETAWLLLRDRAERRPPGRAARPGGGA